MELQEGFVYNIVIVGLGATGSQLLPFVSQLLANYKDNHIMIVDGDQFEAKNLLNQKCMEADVGKSKAEALCERYQSVYPELNISYADQYIKGKDQVIKYLTRFNAKQVKPILISCVDNNATRKIFDEVFYDKDLADLIYIDSGNGTSNRVGQVVVGYKYGETVQVPPYHSYQTGRVEKIIAQKPVADFYPEIREVEETVDATLSCSRVSAEAPQNIATNVMAAATIFTILNNIIAFNQLSSHISYFDAVGVEIISRKAIA